MDTPTAFTSLESLNSLVGGLFLLAGFGMVAARQVKDCVALFIIQSLLLASSAFLLGIEHHSWDLVGVGLVNLVTKPVAIPWIVRRTCPRGIYTRREIDQVLNIPTSLLIAVALVILAYFWSTPFTHALEPAFRGQNIAIGFSGLLLGAFTLTVRREAVPLLLGLLAMENGAFFAGIAMSRNLPLLVELAIATDGLVTVFILGVLTRAVQERVGTTDVGSLTALREGSREDVRS
jgi:hydrogenase-4 component E